MMVERRAFISRSGFGTTMNGEGVSVYTLVNVNGVSAEITNYGGAILSLYVPDRNGKLENIVLGYKTLDEYEAGNAFLGALIGRFANRIAGAGFQLGGKRYSLTSNEGPNHLHGGNRGFDKVVWEAASSMVSGEPSLLLNLVSEDGDGGYPGRLAVHVSYTLTNQNSLRIVYKAETDQPTPVNLTSHSYFNLSGNARRDIMSHRLKIAANRFTPVDAKMIPRGEYFLVKETPFDFRSEKRIDENVDFNHEQIQFAKGYDHNWVIDESAGGKKRFVASLTDPKSGRVLKVHSTEPGLQLYTGNSLGDFFKGDSPASSARYGVCLETQHFPDSPNQPNFPSTILQPGDVYLSTTEYSFSTTCDQMASPKIRSLDT